MENLQLMMQEFEELTKDLTTRNVSDIYSYLADKYGCDRKYVKQVFYVYMYSYNQPHSEKLGSMLKIKK